MKKDIYNISVIVPVYNTEKYLHKCIESLLCQTLKEIEIILVDDGSNDKSGYICDEYAVIDNRVQVIHKKNAGQGLARNDGIKVAKGKYVCFLDSDDYFEKNTCQRLYEVMEESGADICSYGYQIDDKYGKLVTRAYVPNKVYNQREFILHYFGDSVKDEELRGVSSCMSVFRRDIISNNKIEFPSERAVASEDTAFCLEYCKYIKKAVTISDSLYHYCQNEKSFSQGYREDREKLIKAHIELLRKYAAEYNVFDKVKDRIAMTTWINVLAYCKQVYRKLKYKEAIENIRKLAEDGFVNEELMVLDYHGLPIQQKLCYKMLMNRVYFIVYLLVAVRSKKRL